MFENVGLGESGVSVCQQCGKYLGVWRSGVNHYRCSVQNLQMNACVTQNYTSQFLHCKIKQGLHRKQPQEGVCTPFRGLSLSKAALFRGWGVVWRTSTDHSSQISMTVRCKETQDGLKYKELSKETHQQSQASPWLECLQLMANAIEL